MLYKNFKENESIVDEKVGMLWLKKVNCKLLEMYI